MTRCQEIGVVQRNLTTAQLRGISCFHWACLVVPKMPITAGMMMPGREADTMEERPNKCRCVGILQVNARSNCVRAPGKWERCP